jgi:hypothetical protein
MTKSHALLHYPNATLAAARAEAWDGRDPGRIGVLLSNPRWERRLLRFLELSGLGRIVESGLDVEEALRGQNGRVGHLGNEGREDRTRGVTCFLFFSRINNHCTM